MEPEQLKPKKNFSTLKWILIVGIVIVLNLFFNFTIKAIYPEPQFANYCKSEAVNIQPTTKNECVNVGGQWNENTSTVQSTSPVTAAQKVESTSSCDLQFTCRQNFTAATNLYQRNVFIVLIVLGILSIFLGLYFSSITVVSFGLSLGGVLSLIIGSMRYWSAMQDYLRVAVLGLALVMLVWLGVKKFKD